MIEPEVLARSLSSGVSAALPTGILNGAALDPTSLRLVSSGAGTYFATFAIRLGHHLVRFKATLIGAVEAVHLGTLVGHTATRLLPRLDGLDRTLEQAVAIATTMLNQADDVGLHLLGARAAPLDLDLLRDRLRPELIVLGLGDDLQAQRILIDQSDHESLHQALSAVVERQRLRRERARLLASLGAVVLADAVTIAAVGAADGFDVRDLPTLATEGTTRIAAAPTETRPGWTATIALRDGLIRTRGAPDRRHVWEGDHLVLRAPIGGKAAAAMIGGPAPNLFSHPWVDAPHQ